LRIGVVAGEASVSDVCGAINLRQTKGFRPVHTSRKRYADLTLCDAEHCGAEVSIHNAVARIEGHLPVMQMGEAALSFSNGWLSTV